MIITPEQSHQLQDLRVYSITIAGHSSLRHIEGMDPWAGKELVMAVTFHGYGDNSANLAPTWQSTGYGESIATAFEYALTFAPAQRDKANAASRNALHTVLPEYDPDGSRFKRQRQPKSKGPKLSLDQLMNLLD